MTAVQPVEEPIGQTKLTSTYHIGSLSTELPADVRVESVLAASRGALEQRGYTIRHTEMTTDDACVIARPPEGRREVAVRSRNMADATRVTVRFEPWGDHAASTSILEDVLGRLGY